MVTEFYEGGDLQKYMGKRNYEALDEDVVRRFALKLAKGISYLHERNIVHRDIKPENILLDGGKNMVESPVLADFEYAKLLRDKGTCSRICGTKGYMAPEILTEKPYSLPVDIWSFGTLIYALVSSQLPFPVPDQKLQKDNIELNATLILHTKLTFKGKPWTKVSDDLKDLLTRMLKKNPSKRLTIEQVLDHPWFQE